MNVEESIARQEADKKRLSKIILRPGVNAKRRSTTRAEVLNATKAALEDVARQLRFKAKETPGWAAAYHSACAVIEQKIGELK